MFSPRQEGLMTNMFITRQLALCKRDMGHSSESLLNFVKDISCFHGGKKKIMWPESATKLYRPSDRRLSAKLAPTFADTGVSRSQRGGSPTAVILVF
jgi:hypothetical protein